MNTLREEVLAVVENLKSRPWIQGDMQSGEAVCAHGAVMTCQGLRPGDEWIIRAVMRTKGLTEGWNDKGGRTKQQVIEKLARIKVTDEDLAETFGPSWAMVVAVIRRSALLTPEEVTNLGAAWDAALGAARGAARGAAWDAARGAALSDLIGQHGFTQEHFDTLMKPWVSVLGSDWAEGLS